MLASYYGGKGYTTHKTQEAAYKMSLKENEFSHSIIGIDGYTYERGLFKDLVRFGDRPIFEVVEG